MHGIHRRILTQLSSKTRSLALQLPNVRHICTSDEKNSAKAEPVERTLPSQMRRWQIEGYNGLEGVTLVSGRVPPILKPGDMLIRVSAASVNPIDTAMISGYGSGMLNIMRMMTQVQQGIVDLNHIEFPLTVGRDFAGEVVAVGHRVTKYSVGDQVFGAISPQSQGSHAEYVIATATNVCEIPKGVTPEDAASIPYVGLTAWSAVVVSGMMIQSRAPGMRVLLLGATGGIGTFLCQMLSAWGSEVVGVCSSDAMDLALSLGASHTLDYKDPATKELLLRDGGFDLVINAAGIDDMDYMKALKPWAGASYVTLSPPFLCNTDSLGIAGGLAESVRQVMCKNATSFTEGRAYKWAFYMPNPWALQQIAKMIRDHKIRAVIDKVYSFEEVPAAYEKVLQGHARGKTVIKLSE